MSALTAAANDEDSDTIDQLRAENAQLRQALLALHDTLEMTARAGAHHARALAELEAQLEAVGAGGVGPLVPQSGEIPPGWKLVPVVPTKEMLDAASTACNDRMYPADMYHGPRSQDADKYHAMLAAAPESETQAVQLKQHPLMVPADAYDRLEALCQRQAERIMALEYAAEQQDEPVAWIDAVMEQAQVFASAWSLVGGRFDNGAAIDDAEQAKVELRAMLYTRPQPAIPLQDKVVKALTDYCNTGEIDGADDLLASVAYAADPEQQPKQQLTDGARVTVAELEELKHRVNTLAALTTKRERHQFGIRVKREIAELIQRAHGIGGEA